MKHLYTFSIGDDVLHKQFGHGHVVDYAIEKGRARVKVNFEQAGSKWIIAEARYLTLAPASNAGVTGTDKHAKRFVAPISIPPTTAPMLALPHPVKEKRQTPPKPSAPPASTKSSKRGFLKSLFGLASVAAINSASHAQAQRSLPILNIRIAGFAHYHGWALANQLTLGKPLSLKREPTNPHDSNAIAVYFKGQQIGYVPRIANTALNQLLNNGEQLDIKITTMDATKNFEPLKFEVRLYV